VKLIARSSQLTAKKLLENPAPILTFAVRKN
jgi:hypothetical protein